MQNALIIHGSCDKEEYFNSEYPSLSNSHWLPWLQKQLLVNNIFCQTPEMPDAYEPDYQKWKSEFERFTVDEDSILIGHSCGGGFLVRWLSENKKNISKLILVAPWMDPTRFKTTTFFDFEIDQDLQERVKELHLFVADNEDVEGVKQSVQMIKNALPKALVHEIIGKRHFTLNDMKTEKFPELLETVLS